MAYHKCASIYGTNNSAASVQTASGAIANFSTQFAMPLIKSRFNFKATQDLHGQSGPYPAGGQLWDEEWLKGILLSTDGSYAAHNNSVCSKNFNPILPSTSYYPYKGSSVPTSYIYWYDSNRDFISRDALANLVITTPNNASYFKVSCYGYGATYKNDISINYPATDTAYHPYSNICPISGVSAVSVIHCGANLWDEQWEIGMYSTSTGAKESASTVIRCKNPIAVKGGASYYFKNSAAGVAFQIYKYDRNMNYLGYITYGSGVKNLESEVAFITFNLNAFYGTTYNNNLSINYPSTDTEYHAYNPNSNVTLINLGGTYYGGYVEQDKDGHRQFDDTYSGLVNLSDLTFHPTTKGGHTCFYADLPNGVIKSGGEQAFWGKCSTYTVTSNFNMPNDLSCLFYCSELYGGYTRVLIRDDSASAMTGAQFTAYVTGQIVYEKANPQTIALPDGEPIKTFPSINNIFADTGDTSLQFIKLGN